MAELSTGIRGETNLHRRRLICHIDDVESGVRISPVRTAAAECDLLSDIRSTRVGLDLALVDIDV